MKITCALDDFDFNTIESELDVVLYGKKKNKDQGSTAGALKSVIKKKKLVPSGRAWDLLSIALSVVSADLAGHRRRSPDGWTRIFEMTVSVADVTFWQQHQDILCQLLAFLTTDIWTFNFVAGGIQLTPSKEPVYPNEDSVALLSGGVDSLVGVIDLVEIGRKPYAVSQVVRGDANKQKTFADTLGVNIFQVNHNTSVPKGERPPSQRSRSIIFLAYGVFVATTLARYHQGERIPLYVCENGFISINPPLTPSRIGSLSTRTTHPVVFSLLQQLLDLADLRVDIINPYSLKTKGQMLAECSNQELLSQLVGLTTSCGRFGTFNYKHCGRCVPCLVRRSAFHQWKGSDVTKYYFEDLSINDERHAGFDDVRSMLIGIEEWKQQGTLRWLGASLSSKRIEDKNGLRTMIEEGLKEVDEFLLSAGVR